MSEINQNELAGFTRRDFLRGSSLASVMTMLGGVELLAQNTEPPATEKKITAPPVKTALIGTGMWGREIANTLARLEQANIAALCDTSQTAMKRAANDAPSAIQTKDYKEILANKDIKAVIVATPTHLHKDIAIEALKAGKHVYCEAPLANTIEDARAIALAAKAARQLIFQAGLQFRANAQNQHVMRVFRIAALGKPIMARAQWHKKASWQGWRVDKEVSLGLMGEANCGQIDVVNWYWNARPTAVTGFGSVMFHQDGREVPDTVQAVFEYPNGANLICDATLANSFESIGEVFYGSEAAVLMRENKAWIFQEVDATLMGWEIYSRKESLYGGSGIVLSADASKSVLPTQKPETQTKPVDAVLSSSLEIFLRNVQEIEAATEDFITNFGDDANALGEHIAAIQKRPAAGFLEGYQATVTVIKANEAVLAHKRIELKKDLYELG